MLNEVEAKAFISDSVATIYHALQQGMDVSPGDRLRLEGQVELLLEFGIIQWDWLENFINEQYEHYFQESVMETMWLWMKDDKRFYLPAKMHDAPVYLGAKK